MWVASALMLSETSCWSRNPSGIRLPTMLSGTSMVTCSPRRTRRRSTCSSAPLTASRCTAFGSASSAPPSRPSSKRRTLALLSARMSSWPGKLTWRGGVPWPYRTAGTRWLRRTRRAAPLPNSERGCAAMLTSGTARLLEKRAGYGRWVSLTFRGAPARTGASPVVRLGSSFGQVRIDGLGQGALLALRELNKQIEDDGGGRPGGGWALPGADDDAVSHDHVLENRVAARVEAVNVSGVEQRRPAGVPDGVLVKVRQQVHLGAQIGGRTFEAQVLVALDLIGIQLGPE